jgi:hypothetical protein
MNRKLIVSTGILVFSAFSIFLLSNQAIVLSILLILIAVAKHKLYPIKKEMLWFTFICFGGGVVEIFLVNFGKAWSYAYPDFFGIPLYMPVFWGLVGTTIIVMYDGLINNK